MKEYKYRQSENRITHACHYHVVWCTTFRRPVLNDLMRIRMKGLIEDVCAKEQVTIFELDIQPHCVYMHCDMPPIAGVNNLVRRMKRRTASVMRKEFPELYSRLPSLWTLHYFLSTEENKPTEKIEEWMQTQPRFHRVKGRDKK